MKIRHLAYLLTILLFLASGIACTRAKDSKPSGKQDLTFINEERTVLKEFDLMRERNSAGKIATIPAGGKVTLLGCDKTKASDNSWCLITLITTDKFLSGWVPAKVVDECLGPCCAD